MNFPRFTNELRSRSGKFDALDVGALIALLMLESEEIADPGQRQIAIVFRLGLLDRRLAEAEVSEELRQVMAGAHNSVMGWISESKRDPE